MESAVKIEQRRENEPYIYIDGEIPPCQSKEAGVCSVLSNETLFIFSIPT